MRVRPNADGTIESQMYDTIPPHADVQVMTVRSKKQN
jgi:hypothetical protein